MSAEKFRMHIAALSTTTSSSNEFVLKKILTDFRSDPTKPHLNEFILSGVSSKDIVKLLSLLENESPKIRKLSLLALTYIIHNACSKIYFLEKCGLGLNLGKVFLTRLKYLHTNVPQVDKATQIMKALLIKGHKKHLQKKDLFWYVPLPNTKAQPSADISVGYCHFDEGMVICDANGDYVLTEVPDPLFNVCGVEIEDNDFVEYEIHFLNSSKRFNTNTNTREMNEMLLSNVSDTNIGSMNMIHLETQKNLFGRQNEFSFDKVKNSSPERKATPKSFLKDKVIRTVVQKSAEKVRTSRNVSVTKPSTPIAKKNSMIEAPKKDIRIDKYASNQSPLRLPGSKVMTSMARSPNISQVQAKPKISQSPISSNRKSSVNEKVSKLLSSKNKI